MLLKTTGLKLIIVGFILIYLLSPIQTHVYKLLHYISHEITELTNTISNENYQHHSISHHHEFLNSTVKVKKSHQHSSNISASKHTHQVISLFENILSKSTNTPNKDKYVTEIKLDKHIVPHLTPYKIIILPEGIKNHWRYINNSKSITPKITLPPPKFV